MMPHAYQHLRVATLTAVAAMSACTLLRQRSPDDKPAPQPASVAAPLIEQKIDHVVVIYQENWSFDGLYGRFPGANGLASASPTAVAQLDRAGKPLTVLPQPVDSSSPPKPDPRFPANLPVKPYDAKAFVPGTAVTGDLVHRFYQEQLQIAGGKMNQYVAWSNNGGLTMSYFDATTLPEGQLASEFTLADNLFHSAFGGSFINHIWFIAAAAPPWSGAPVSDVAQLDPATGVLVRDGAVTPDGYAVNTVYPTNKPYPAEVSDPAARLPALTLPTIGDRLTAAHVPWAWYSGGWNDAVAGKPDPEFQFHHQPFNYFAAYADGQPGRAHLKDLSEFQTALDTGQLPAVAFVKQLGEYNEHPGYADLADGQAKIGQLVAAIRRSSAWSTTAIIITYDENGGRWDHVAPPVIDRWGPGTRVPTIIVSPWAKRHFIDHTQYESVSVLKFIETRWHLLPLTDRDGKAEGLQNAFDFTQTP